MNKSKCVRREKIDHMAFGKKKVNEMVHMVSGTWSTTIPQTQQARNRRTQEANEKKTTECFAINDVCGLVDDCVINVNSYERIDVD